MIIRPIHIVNAILLFLLVCVVVAVAVTVYTYVVNRREHFYSESDSNPPTIYAIMVTGKDDQRIAWARLAVKNFEAQTYAKKRLLIINHHQTARVMTTIKGSNIVEIAVPYMPLGQLRNMALELVPYNALWTTWDDDDVRDPGYLSTLADALTLEPHTVHAVSFCNRIEVNLKTNFVWGVSLKPQGTVHILCRASDKRIRFLPRETMEDVNLKKDILELGYRLNVINDNDPLMYIRLVHDSNTSLYVDPERTEIKYGFEFEPTNKQKDQAFKLALPYKT